MSIVTLGPSPTVFFFLVKSNVKVNEDNQDGWLAIHCPELNLLDYTSYTQYILPSNSILQSNIISYFLLLITNENPLMETVWFQLVRSFIYTYV